jgi:hypothetical protein
MFVDRSIEIKPSSFRSDMPLLTELGALWAVDYKHAAPSALGAPRIALLKIAQHFSAG